MRTAKRAGVSLTELLVVMGVSLTALSSATALIRHAYVQERALRQGFDAHRPLSRLVEDFRRDVRFANTAVITSPSEATSDDQERVNKLIVELQQPSVGNQAGARIEYRFAARHITRREEPIPPDAAIAATVDHQVRHESYALPENTVVRVERMSAPERLRLICQQPRLPEALHARNASNYSTPEMDQLNRVLAHVEVALGKYSANPSPPEPAATSDDTAQTAEEDAS